MDVPEGANGGDSLMVLDYLQKCITEELRWDLLVINCGLHDIKRYDGNYQINPVEYERNLVQIFEHVSKLCSEIIWIRTTPVIDEVHNSRMSEFERFNDDVEKYNEIADRVANSKGVWMVDLNTFCQSLGGSEIYYDHVHFTAEAQRLQGAFIAGHVNAFLGGQVFVPKTPPNKQKSLKRRIQ